MARGSDTGSIFAAVGESLEAGWLTKDAVGLGGSLLPVRVGFQGIGPLRLSRTEVKEAS